MRTTVHLLRHGEVHNPTKILYGRLPGFQLSDLGRQMAKAAASALAEHDVMYVVSSPLERAIETAQPMAEQFNLPIATDPDLIESSNYFEGMRVGAGDGALRDPRHWRVLHNPFRPSWGEAYRDIAVRMTRALHAARDAARGHEAVCVSHQLPIWTLRTALEGRRLWHDPRRRQCGLASLTSFVFEDDRLAQITYAEPAAHLGPGAGRGA
ncbi:histidine phosphatase family protein [Catellatospora sp. KI3]|uniref:histidine phosphatase family protein n=1 Tax=Catellatospora sp. KI3 TaxID=3041620 RepID=UPI002482D7CC|nr:histidine phosphatase family protein [Catellatospora sp. KI3]MDI1461851.1 histidine phosphatase family protein [Catellatospora sp. KI3]